MVVMLQAFLPDFALPVTHLSIRASIRASILFALLPVLMLSLASCSAAIRPATDSTSLSDEIELLRASAAHARASNYGLTRYSQNTSGSTDTTAGPFHVSPGHVSPGHVSDPVYPGQRTVEEHSRWPSRSNAPLVNPESLNQADLIISLNAVDLPLNVLLYSLAQEAELDLALQGSHAQLVTLRSDRKSVRNILDSLARQASFRWQIDGSRLQILPDIPYLKTYRVNYLNLTRRMQGSVGLATQVGSISLGQQGGGSGNFSNSSQSLIENESHHAFWESLVDGLNSLFGGAADSPTMLSVNRDASLVSVRAKESQHVDIKHYLDEVERSTQRQVLIEATVVEINLSDKFDAGIDWRVLGEGSDSVSAAQVFHGKPDVSSSTLDKLPAPSALLSAIHRSNTLGKISATLNLLNQFGDVKILSRPQIIAINNQSAVLKVVDNRVYFTMRVERQSRDGEDDLTTETEIHTVPVGLVMSVTPFVTEDDDVVLNVRPTISRILGFVNDPNPELASARVQNGVPEIQVREMESVLKVGSGQIAMIGGLMQEQMANDHTGVPWLNRVPLLGGLFSHKARRSGTTELLVFLQPTVLSGGKMSR